MQLISGRAGCAHMAPCVGNEIHAALARAVEQVYYARDTGVQQEVRLQGPTATNKTVAALPEGKQARAAWLIRRGQPRLHESSAWESNPPPNECCLPAAFLCTRSTLACRQPALQCSLPPPPCNQCCLLAVLQFFLQPSLTTGQGAPGPASAPVPTSYWAPAPSPLSCCAMKRQARCCCAAC